MGARAVIQREYPRAVYVHCPAHALNLAVVKSCENPYIRNMLGVVERVAVFFGDSAKRHLRLSESISNSETAAFPNRRGLPTMSETRWSSRAVTTETFVGNYEAIHDALVGLARDGDGTAATLLASTETDDFIIALVVADLFLGYINTLSHKLQAVHLNLIEPCSEAENIIECLQDERSSECFSRFVQKAQQMLGRPLQLPRIAYRTMHRPNAPAGDAEEHYLRSLYFPFMDHLLCEINDRLCSVEVKALVKGGLLLPPALSSISEEDIGSIQRFYGPDLPDYGHLHQEVRRWKKKWEGFGESLSIERGLEEARGFYPNIYVIHRPSLFIPGF